MDRRTNRKFLAFTAQYALSPYVKYTRFFFKYLYLYFIRKSHNSKTIKNKIGNVRKNVTLRRVLATIVAVEKHYILCVSVALANQNAMRMPHIIICDLLCSTVFFHVIS
jgi:hypothetical protein